MRRLTAVGDAPRGVLQLQAGLGRFEVARFLPGPDLAVLVEHYWMVSWDLRGRAPHTQHTLPHPGVHLVAEPDRPGIQGVLTGRFTRRLEGRTSGPPSATPRPPTARPALSIDRH